MDTDFQDLTQSVLHQFIGPVDEGKYYHVGCYEAGKYERKDSFGYSYEGRKFRSAKSQQLGRIVILKKIQNIQNPALNELIYNNEVKILSHLNNSSVAIRLLTHWKINNQFYIVLERNAYGNLAEFADYLNNKKLALTEQEILFFFKEILQASQALHEQKIVHGNLKLESIALDDELRIKITDFSLAKHDRSSQFEGPVKFGTPNYMAPELLLNEQFLQSQDGHEKSQVWSIGVIMYNLIYGKFPINPSEPNIKITFPKTQHSKNKQLVKLLSKMLQIDPSKRISIKSILSSIVFNSLQAHPTIQSKIIQKYHDYFEQRKKQKSTWKRNLDYCKLQVPCKIMAILEKSQKVTIIKIIKDTRYGYFILLSNLQLIAHFFNDKIIKFQKNLICKAENNEQRILVWIYWRHFAVLIKQKMKQQNNIMYEQLDCSIKKLIEIKGSVFARLTNQTIQVFFARKEVNKDRHNAFQSFSTTLCVNYSNRNPTMVKISKEDRQQIGYQNLLKGIQQKNKYCQYVREVFSAIVENSLAKLDKEKAE